MPKVSLIIPVYNRPELLFRAVFSALVQTFSDFELIIVDDFSDIPVIESLAKQSIPKDSRITIIRNSVNLGQTESLISGIAVATAPYIGWLDSDDWLHPTCLEYCNDFLDTNSDVGLVYTNYYVCKDEKIKSMGKRSEYSKSNLLLNFCTFHFRLFRRHIYNVVGGLDPFYKFAQDYDFCLKVSETSEIKMINKPLYYYSIHSEQKSNKQLEQIDYSFSAIQSAMFRRNLSLNFQLRIIPSFAIVPLL